ncbi:hypothetical protein JJB98_10060 [Bradyrhizobium diazoefficiens]|nr:hypothetical protein [Bradyrhizobium diazoefficiens]QQO20234.1 hypothetical protein JJB98_10060 [Bradyrhizobium diazoefficiens]
MGLFSRHHWERTVRLRSHRAFGRWLLPVPFWVWGRLTKPLRTALLAIAVVLAVGGGAKAAEKGMYLCRSPVVANDYWNAVNVASGTGLRLTQANVADIAASNGCVFAASPNLKPVNFVAGMFEMTDGKLRGWASPQAYILYVNR